MNDPPAAQVLNQWAGKDFSVGKSHRERPPIKRHEENSATVSVDAHQFV